MDTTSSQEPREMKIVLGIVTVPIVLSNFSDESGNNPFQDSISKMCSQVLQEQVAKITNAVAELCDKNGFGFEVMESKAIIDAAIQALQQDDGKEQVKEFKGVMEGDSATIDEDYLAAKTEGRSTKN